MIASQHLINFFDKNHPHNEEYMGNLMTRDWSFQFEDESRITVLFRVDMGIQRCSFTLMNNEFIYMHLFKICPQRREEFDYEYPPGILDIYLNGKGRQPYPVYMDVEPSLDIQKNKHRKKTEALLVRFVLELC